jgi:hypothetical protein
MHFSEPVKRKWRRNHRIASTNIRGLTKKATFPLKKNKESNVLYQLIFQQKHSLKFKNHEVYANGSSILFVIRYTQRSTIIYRLPSTWDPTIDFFFLKKKNRDTYIHDRYHAYSRKITKVWIRLQIDHRHKQKAAKGRWKGQKGDKRTQKEHSYPSSVGALTICRLVI